MHIVRVTVKFFRSIKFFNLRVPKKARKFYLTELDLLDSFILLLLLVFKFYFRMKMYELTSETLKLHYPTFA